MQEIHEQKAALRRELRARREALSPEDVANCSREIATRIATSTCFRRADLLLLYAPIGRELNLLPLVREARKRGIPVAFPVSDTASTTLTFRILTPDARLAKGAYSIPEPPADAPVAKPTRRTLCVLPGLSFSPSGARIGYGKGYYDRFLSNFEGIAVGVAPECMLSLSIPTEPTDLPVSMIFTERGTIRCRDKLTGSGKRGESSDTSSVLSLSAIKRRWHTWRENRHTREKKESDAKALAPARPLHLPPSLVLTTYLLLILSRLVDTASSDRANASVAVMILQWIVFFVPAILYAIAKGDRFSLRIRFQKPRFEHTWFCFCALVVMITGSLLTSILTGGMSSLTGGFTLYNTFTAQNVGSFADTVALILAYAIVPAFCEELIFRAYLCAEYESLGVGVSVAASALFFAMLHFSFTHFLTYLLLGALLSLVLYATRSFFSVLLLHVLYNLFCMFGQPYLTTFYVTAGSNDIFIFCLVTLCLLFAAFGAGEARKIYHLYARANLSSDYTVSRPVKELPKTVLIALASPLTAACVIAWIVMSILNL